MKINRNYKPLASLLAAVLCVAAFSVTAFASGDDWCEWGEYDAPDTAETPTPMETQHPEPTQKPPTVTPAPALTDTPKKDGPTENMDDVPAQNKVDTLTPPGNMTLIDDVIQRDDAAGEGEEAEREEKQFIVVQSKNGNYFYLVIDRSGNEENVHFLNQVDEVDLLALTEDGKPEEVPASCTCTDKCVVGSINTTCPVCQTTMSDCTGKEVEPTPTDEPDTEPEQPETKPGGNAALLVMLMLALVGGGAIYFLKFRKKKPDTKGPVDLDDYDFGDDEDGEDEDYEFEPDDDEQPERNEGD